ncbi:Vi polysaccharide export inner membrane protein VexD [Roseibium album]|nr:Vi polysaccharide export inner membrane protein VexD [Roseibium album]
MSSAKKATKKDDSTSVVNADVVTLPNKRQSVSPATRYKDKSLVDRLKKSGLDPQRLLDLALPKTTTKANAKTRHFLIILGFIFAVLTPALAFTGYMFFFASDQYHSSAAFAVRSSSAPAATEILGMVLGGGAADSATSNSYIVNDYIQSQTIIEDLSSDVEIEEIFNREGTDWLFRMGTDLPIEDKLAYWNDMVDVSYDSTSSVIYLEIRSFEPEDSVLIAEAIIEKSEVLVNELSEVNRRESVKFAEESVARAEARLKAIRKQMQTYRQETQEVSPEAGAQIAVELLGGLDQEVNKKQAQLDTLLTYLDEDSPRIRILSQEIEALNAQIASVRERVGSGTTAGGDAANLSARMSEFSELSLEEEFARQLYTTSLAGLEQARQDAMNETIYLATFIKPTLSQAAQYPSRFLYSLAVFCALFGIWLVSVLMYYNIRDRT